MPLLSAWAIGIWMNVDGAEAVDRNKAGPVV